MVPYAKGAPDRGYYDIAAKKSGFSLEETATVKPDTIESVPKIGEDGMTRIHKLSGVKKAGKSTFVRGKL